MNILSDVKAIADALELPVETGNFSKKPPDTYLVIVPMTEEYDCYADNLPGIDIQEARLSLFSKGNYKTIKNRLLKAFLDAGLTITGRQYIGYETETGYYHFNIDVAQFYELED